MSEPTAKQDEQEQELESNAANSQPDFRHQAPWSTLVGYLSFSQPNRSLETDCEAGENHGIWPRNHPDYMALLPDEQRQFIAACTGISAGGADAGPYHRAAWRYLQLMNQEIHKIPAAAFTEILLPEDTNTIARPPASLIYHFLNHIVATLRLKPLTIIDDIIDKAVASRILIEDCSKPGTGRESARQFVIACSAWATLFYTPIYCGPVGPNAWHFRIDLQRADGLPSTTLTDNMCRENIPQILRALNLGLPSKADLVPTRHISSELLHVSYLNASALRSTGGIEIEWVTCLSSHLDFDSVSRRLSLFCLPSFCEVQKRNDSVMSSILDEYYDEWTRPENYKKGGLSHEIRLSYKLLFGDNKRSRRVYRWKERAKAKAKAGGYQDPLLDELCGMKKSPHVRFSYDQTDFPIFSSRLHNIQADIRRQQPNQISHLWRDKSDILRWSTFWTVVFVGAVGLFIAIVQVVESAIQVEYAVKAYNSPQVPSVRI